jgi:hypothetical protein
MLEFLFFFFGTQIVNEPFIKKKSSKYLPSCIKRGQVVKIVKLW